MALNESKGNMYYFVSHTWNPIKGKCSHDCGYCYMKRWGNQKPIHLDEKELKTDLGEGNFIFVGSSCDLFADDVPGQWIIQVLNHCNKFNNNYLFQTKNPMRILVEDWHAHPIFKKSVVCTTIESSHRHPQMGNTPSITNRATALLKLNNLGIDTYVTIEPIMDFDLDPLVDKIQRTRAKQVNIGADSKGSGLIEPSKEKILALIEILSKFTKVVQKPNLKRLLK